MSNFKFWYHRFTIVVMKTGFVEHFSTVPEFNTNNKISEYARENKKEYLIIRGINKEFKYFIDNYLTYELGFLKIYI